MSEKAKNPGPISPVGSAVKARAEAKKAKATPDPVTGLTPVRKKSLWHRIPPSWRTPFAIVATIVAAAWIVIALIGPAIAPHNPLAQDMTPFQGPGAGHIFGTDELGRDVFSRVIAGARVSIGLAILLVCMSTTVGTILGTVAGFFGKWVDEVIMRFTDLVMAFPTVILAMVIAAALGPSLFNAVLAALVVSWPQYARTVRSMVLSLRGADFVSSGRLLGYGPIRSMRRDVLPNVVGPTLVLSSLDIGTSALLLSGLSFLGLGAKPPSPEWGSMISEAVKHFDKWWLGIFPGLALLTVVISFNFLGDALRDSFDPGTERE
ncbi:MAG: ABC transporter permease [Bifidobacteriaceae bacterium]|jgi:peptide/nickel transport system permease protein|nr:ABC transporter permease [Bifidobacteriaceae bacterium]